ncbi:Pimeloyl-ACP methyl ester carboxylesterase [Ralstonia sp. 25mfcol4.1]|uniref:alpha/beta hydrolase n=1 Tax=Burkholderiaceae TaxID=119060 RepID=UPI0008830133|nr:alpha/beta hydrolase [Ralstonia sp. 25mfcol4.1]SDP77086.1 Pimeloyl-ACP methyl ester carboxylesterase [Ralstonia sp. 25mfcol4.1]
MKRNHPLLAALATAAAFTFAQGAMAQVTPAPQTPAAAAAATAPVRNIVLVHGLYADGSSWEKVIPLLQARGYHVTSVQNPTTSLDADVDAVRRALALQDGPTLLVAHSYAGMVISQAGDDPKVAGLVYIAARAPDAGEDYPALTRRFPAAPASAGLQWSADGYGKLSEQAFVNDFAGDLPKAEAEAYYAVQQPMGKAVTMARTTVAAWRHKPTWYAVSTQDRTINPDLERFMAKRMGAFTIEIPASHVSLISHPKDVADLIVQAASGQGSAKVASTGTDKALHAAIAPRDPFADGA